MTLTLHDRLPPLALKGQKLLAQGCTLGKYGRKQVTLYSGIGAFGLFSAFLNYIRKFGIELVRAEQ